MKSLVLEGDKIGSLWLVTKKLGEGGCGMVFEVTNDENKLRFAMKVESSKLKRGDQLIKIEALILKKMQFSKYAPRYICYDRTKTFRILIMGLLGNSVDDLLYSVPNKKLSLSATLRIGLQALEAVTDLHRIGFVHRDIKPSNFAFGLEPNTRHLYIFDFGMARSIIDMKNNSRLRRPRKKANFRSLLYMCIYLIVGSLPWSKRGRGNAGMIKIFLEDKYLLQFAALLKYFRSLTYADKPDYSAIKEVFKACMVARGINNNDLFDWEIDNMQIVKQSRREKSIRSFTAIGGLNSHSAGSDTCDGFTSVSAEADTLEVFTPPYQSTRTANIS